MMKQIAMILGSLQGAGRDPFGDIMVSAVTEEYLVYSEKIVDEGSLCIPVTGWGTGDSKMNMTWAYGQVSLQLSGKNRFINIYCQCDAFDHWYIQDTEMEDILGACRSSTYPSLEFIEVNWWGQWAANRKRLYVKILARPAPHHWES